MRRTKTIELLICQNEQNLEPEQGKKELRSRSRSHENHELRSRSRSHENHELRSRSCVIFATTTQPWYVRVTGDGAWKLIQGVAKLTQFCVSFIALWSQNGSVQTPQSCQFFNRSLLRSLPMIMNFGL